MRGATRQRGCWSNGPTPELVDRNGTGSSSSAPPALERPPILCSSSACRRSRRAVKVPAGTAFLNAPRAPCATSPEAAHSPRPPTPSCALLGAAFASRPSETQVRDAQEQRQGATKSPSAARRRSRPEARSGRRRGREYLLLAGLRAERTWGVFNNTCSAMPIVLIDVQREGEEIWRDDERCRWWRGGARRARRRRLGAGGFIKHHSYLPDRQRRHTTAAWS